MPKRRPDGFCRHPAAPGRSRCRFGWINVRSNNDMTFCLSSLGWNVKSNSSMLFINGSPDIFRAVSITPLFLCAPLLLPEVHPRTQMAFILLLSFLDTAFQDFSDPGQTNRIRLDSILSRTSVLLMAAPPRPAGHKQRSARTSTSMSYCGLLGLIVYLARPFMRRPVLYFRRFISRSFFKAVVKTFVLEPDSLSLRDLVGRPPGGHCKKSASFCS